MRKPGIARKKFPAGKARGIKILILDVDGVMTDGRIIVSASGEEAKNFSVYDGVAITLGMKQGLKFAFLSARKSEVTAVRARELGIEDVLQVGGPKLPAYEAILEKHGLDDSEAAYMGDDIHDLEVMKRAGLSAAPANASAGAALCADYVSRAQGGGGAVREVVELILGAKGRKLSLLTAVLPLALAMLWGCSAAPDAPPAPPPAEQSAPAEKVEGGFRYTAAERGSVVMEIEGERAWGLSASEPELVIERPRVKRPLEGGGAWAEGERGVFDKNTMDLVFEGNASAGYGSGSAVKADRIEWLRSESMLRAEGSVEGIFYLDFEDGPEGENRR